VYEPSSNKLSPGSSLRPVPGASCPSSSFMSARLGAPPKLGVIVHVHCTNIDHRVQVT
jgi:hypothetical protein